MVARRAAGGNPPFWRRCRGQFVGMKSRRSARAVRPVAISPSLQRARAGGRSETDQQLLLDTVLNNMSQGVLMFDPETRMVFCNQRYIEMYGLSGAIGQPGCTLP